MSEMAGMPPLRVEQALRVLPDVEGLSPLRAYLIATSVPGVRESWRRTASYGTVGKRVIDSAGLRRAVPDALARASAHLSALYDGVVSALEHEQRGDMVGVVQALLGAGTQEERVGRLTPALAWYEHARVLSEELREREPEIAALQRLGHLHVTAARYDDGARCFQRSLALAEAEFDRERVIDACQGLGDASRAQGLYPGAESWYTRALTLAEAGPYPSRIAGIQLALGEVARLRGDASQAGERLGRARALSEASGDVDILIRVLDGLGQLDAQLGRRAEALDRYRDALERLERAGGRASLETMVRLHLSELHLERGAALEAEDEMRRCEELAIAHNHSRHLAQVYTLMGRVRGQQGDAEGFIFFEKALELVRGPEPALQQEGEVYHEYGRFRLAIGDREEADAYLEWALTMFEALGMRAAADRVRADVTNLPPA